MEVFSENLFGTTTVYIDIKPNTSFLNLTNYGFPPHQIRHKQQDHEEPKPPTTILFTEEDLRSYTNLSQKEKLNDFYNKGERT